MCFLFEIDAKFANLFVILHFCYAKNAFLHFDFLSSPCFNRRRKGGEIFMSKKHKKKPIQREIKDISFILKNIGGQDRVFLDKLHKVTKGRFENKDPDKLTPDDQISITSDTMFSTMFCNESRKEYPCRMLADFLGIDFEYLMEHSHYYKNVFDRSSVESKGQRGDLVLEIEGNYILVEMNNDDVHQRNEEYSDHMYSSYIKVGEEYIYPLVLSLSLNNFYYEEIDEPVLVFWNQTDNQLSYSKKVRVHVFLPLYKKIWYNGGDVGKFGRTLLAMAETDHKEALRIARGDDQLERYTDEAKKAEKSSNFMKSYTRERVSLDAERKIGREEGREEGLESGKELGSSEERQKFIKNMLEDGISTEVISKYANLSVEEVENIIRQLKDS